MRPKSRRNTSVLLSFGVVALTSMMFGGVSARACNLNVARKAFEIKAVVVGAASPEETDRQTKIATMRTGGPPTERFLPLPRILADYRDENGAMHRTIAAVTDGHIPSPGASVLLRSRYLDPDDECHYIPWTVVDGPAA